jgi:membrane protein DedA with SNARE-associated domain
MLSWLVEHLERTTGAVSYALLVAFVFADASLFVGFLLPGEAPAIVGGVLSGRGSLHVAAVVGMTATAAAVGDSCGYALGRFVGTERAVRWGRRFGVTRERLDAVEAFFEKHGGKAVFAGRFASALRAFVPYVAGTTRMPYRRFVAFNAPACVIWAATFVGLGYAAGDNWREAARWVDRAGWALLIGFATLLVWKWHRSRSATQE